MELSPFYTLYIIPLMLSHGKQADFSFLKAGRPWEEAAPWVLRSTADQERSEEQKRKRGFLNSFFSINRTILNQRLRHPQSGFSNVSGEN